MCLLLACCSWPSEWYWLASLQVWDFETIDNADIVEESNVFEMEPLLEVKVRWCYTSLLQILIECFYRWLENSHGHELIRFAMFSAAP